MSARGWLLLALLALVVSFALWLRSAWRRSRHVHELRLRISGRWRDNFVDAYAPSRRLSVAQDSRSCSLIDESAARAVALTTLTSITPERAERPHVARVTQRRN